MTPRIHDDRACALGEGVLWHPTRNQLFWFDILGKRLMSQSGDGAPIHWDWDDHPSAAGWTDDATLFVATATGLWTFDIASGIRDRVAPLEAGDPGTRSNDGRADPLGGFWIGTTGLGAEAGRGAIYRYFRGEVRLLYEQVTIPNAICFAPGGDLAYFADTAKGAIWSQHLDRAGWPSGAPEMFCDYSAVGVNPDGAVVDETGDLWVAQWDAWRVACHGPDGRFRRSIALPAARVTCPAFGGPDRRTLFVTSATTDLPDAPHHGQAGRTFAVDLNVAGQPEHRVVL
ncbi:SMP-30/gluconolactonase/LRE family protein [Jannaschia sp. LMIT008]|uniref:SMP-30/gluconolactonase/LRE family protein n=1 Tax=Jannaschia maritima TaxID=3032585 RepID=UPI0028111255|nr:SMP-30/gluconolactonase/LRE family protein [Jannaschia sp. LMIT008]